MKITLTYGAVKEVIELNKPTKVIDIIDNKNKEYVCCLVNKSLKDLNYVLTQDANVKLVAIYEDDGARVFQATLRYLTAMAVKQIYPKARITYSYSISRSIFASVSDLGRPFQMADMNAIKAVLDDIIAKDYELSFKELSMENAIKYYSDNNMKDKVNILKYRNSPKSHIYECNGYMNYLHSPLMPRTSYITNYSFQLSAPGFLILYPRSDLKGNLPEVKDERVLHSMILNAKKWANTIKAESIYQINQIIDSKQSRELINLCEAKHNRQLSELGAAIEAKKDDIRMICVAGPSSSGKTTFTNRLRIELTSRGITPFMISMDDFYNEGNFPIDEYGKVDYEHVEALNLELFDQVIFNLIQGEMVALPEYNFKTHKRSFKDPVRIDKNTPILIEGIHGLNDRIAPSIPNEQKFKVFIAPLGQYRIDSHTPISLSDQRLIRRIVRDAETRNTTCDDTLATWASVRRGEFKWIYPCQNNADFVFNSELTYELCVLKKYALPLLLEVPNTSDNYVTARRLIKFLRYYEPISDKWIPCNSILREFVGGSIFYAEYDE